jgi:hypothetical protein
VWALNRRGRGGSAAINDDSFVKMSIADVVDDIDKVARCFDTPPGYCYGTNDETTSASYNGFADTWSKEVS